MVLEHENFLDQARPLARAGFSAKAANSKDETLFLSAQDHPRGAAVTGEAELTPAEVPVTGEAERLCTALQ